MPRGSDVIARFLDDQGVECVFELVGGMITHLLDSIHQGGHIRIVSMHHEQGAAFAAEGHARITGVPGVAMATSGPGATNLLTGVASCYFDSTPAVFITGQVNRNELKGSSDPSSWPAADARARSCSTSRWTSNELMCQWRTTREP
jgi:acetolactate synthase-1/2/3 large subunit